MSRQITVALLAISVGLCAARVRAQSCEPAWADQFPVNQTDGVVHALLAVTDTVNPTLSTLYVGGNFSQAGGVSASCIARWDGYTWSAVGNGLNGTVFTLTEFDEDGAGPHGSAVFAAGNFTYAGIIGVNHVARWDGTSWSPLGAGVNGVVYALTVYDDDGPGAHAPALVAGGIFNSAGAVFANNIAQWDGNTWSPLGLGLDNYVNALAIFDEDDAGPGLPALFAGGGFGRSGATVTTHVARWNGANWSPLAPTPLENGVNNSVCSLAVFDEDGAGPGPAALFLGGFFIKAGVVNAAHLARWTGTAWSAVGSGVDGAITAMTVCDDDGDGPRTAGLYLGGGFTVAGGIPASRIARWDGTTWAALGTGLNDDPHALATFDDTHDGVTPPALYVGGLFTSAGGIPSGRIARWGCPPAAAPPEIVTQPQSQAVCPAGSVTFSVVVVGTRPMTYQWRKFGQPLSGATDAALTIAGVTADDAGDYDVVVANDFGSATSDPATLKLGELPVIAEQPQSRSVCWHQSVTFTVVADGPPPLSYQWRRDGQVIYGALGSSYTIGSATPDHSGTYTVTVTGPCGSVESEPAVLTVDAGPSIDQQPASRDACLGATVTLSVTVSGPGPIAYQWRKDGEPIAGANEAAYTIVAAQVDDSGIYDVQIDTPCASAVSDAATLKVYGAPTITQPPESQQACAGRTVTFSVEALGASPLSYTWRKDGQAIAGAHSSSYTTPALTPAHAGEYDAIVDSPCGATTSAAATLTIALAPTIDEGPQPQTVCAGERVNFAVSASGTAPLTHQWRKDGQDVNGATGATYVIDAVQSAQAGQYDVVVTNSCGSATSLPAALTITPGPSIDQPPASQSVCSGASVMFEVHASGNGTLSYQWRKNTLPIDGATDITYSIGSAVPADAGQYDVVVTASCGSVTSAPATLAVGTGPIISQPPQSQTACAGTTVTMQVAAVGPEPLTYQWRKNGQPIGGATGSSYTIASVALTDAGQYDALVGSPCGSTTSAAATLSISTVPTIERAPQPQSVCAASAVTFSVAAHGAPPLTYQWRKDGQPIPGATGETFTIAAATVDSAGLYDVIVSGPCGSVTSAVAALTVSVGPAVAQPPQSQSVCVGGSATLSVSVTASGSVTYQWRKGGTPIGGATSNIYTINPITAADAGQYDVVVGADCGTITSIPATLTVGVAPVIDQPPESQSVCSGAAATFRVTASGAGPLQYQWRKDGSAITGATDSAYKIASITPADLAAYDVVITGACGSVVSAAASLGMLDCLAPPAEPAQPDPAQGATRTAGNVELAWAPATGASAYDVYGGGGTSRVLLGSTNECRWSLAGLTAGTTYYWQVVARNAGGATLGPVWWFKVAANSGNSGGTSGSSGNNPPDNSGNGTAVDDATDNPPDDGSTPPDSSKPGDSGAPVDQLPPECGVGTCGAGMVGAAPLTFFGLCGMKWGVRRATRRSRLRPGRG